MKKILPFYNFGGNNAMALSELLSKVKQLDIKLWVEDGRLRYNAPEGVLTDDLKAEIIKNKPEIIEFLVSADNAQKAPDQIEKAPRNVKLPVSYAQKWLWLYDQVESNSFAFNIPSVVRMKGNLVIPALESGINEIIKRHEILRTVIISEGNEVYQKILPELTVTLPVEDLQTLSESEQEKKVYEYFNEQSQLSFNLETGPYLRFKLLQIKEDEYALVFTFHHSISDNWSLNIFITELAALYKAALNKEKAVLPELAIQYADYAAWQQNYLKSTQAESKFNYWKERLKDIDQVPSLPTDYPRPTTQSRKSIRKYKILPGELVQKLNTLSQKERCSLYVTLLAAFKVLLHQYTGLENIIVGSPVAGRTRKELEGLIGFFINTVALWTKLNPQATFKDFIKEVRKTTVEAFANQEIPFETLVDELQPKRQQGKTPFFQAFFNMYSSSFEFELPELKITPYSSDMIGAQNYNSKFDMTLLVIEHQAGCQIDFSFSSDLFADSTGTWLFQQYCKLLEAIVEDPDRKLSELPELCPKEHQIIEPKQPFSPIKREEVEQPLNVRFEKIAKQLPQHIAVESNERRLTYEELNKQANRIGRLISDNDDQYLGLTKKERIRYTRQIMLDGWGIESQEILKKTTVFAAGAGGSGSPVIMQLALLGIGTIIICDFDQVELSNLNRQVLHDESRIGMNKAESAALTVKRINPNVKVIVRTEKITKDNIYELVGDAAVIFDNLDDIEAKFVISECAVAKGIPHVISSMIEMSSYAAIFHTPYTPCFHCLYDRNKLEFVRELRKDQSGWNKVSNPVSSPALFASAGFACNEAIKIILGYQNVAYNKYFFFNQQASREFPNTTGYKIVTYPFSEHFKTISKKQGFDWDEGWNERFIEELAIEKDPSCSLCGKDQPEGIAEAASAKIAVAAARSGNEETGDVAQITVGLLLEHDLEMIVGILGVLKSGNIFVTIDPTYPEDRLLYMLEDTGARIIITDNSNLEKAIKLRDKVNKHIRIVNINEDYGSISDDNLPERNKPDSLSYIMYTSGSTGYPKGVMQKHRNVLHFIMNYTNGLHINSEDRLSLIPSFSFSASMMDTFAALLNGATLCLYNVRKEGPAGLGKWLIEKRITVYHSVPTVFRHFVAGIAGDMSFPDLRLIDFGGEPVSSVDVELYKKHFSNDCLLVNGLGATELNVIRQYPINHQTELIGNLVPVGYPVSDTEILLIDESGREVKYNRPGEIVIKSEFLSPGYWEMEEQTGKVFKQDETTAKRLYYTGDLGRLRTDGCLEHLGRKDSQLKIRGIRIEASEIETALLELPFIKEAAVTAEENAQGDKQLVAYVVEQPDQKIEIDEILEHLRERLPDYMVPGSFVKLDRLPLTYTGKVDRRLLKAAGGESLNEKRAYEAPRNETEQALVDIWSKVLALDKIGIHDVFFQIGGDSLAALRVIDLVHQNGLECTPNQLMNNPTIARLAKVVSLKQIESNDRMTNNHSDAGPKILPLTGDQKWFLDIIPKRINPSRFNMAILVEVDFPLDPSLIRKVLDHLLGCHEALKACFIKQEGVWKQHILERLDQEYVHYYDLSSLSEDEQRVTLEETIEKLQDSLDIIKGPLLKFAYFNLGEARSGRFFAAIHHLVGDNTSLMILLNDFQTAYQQLAQTGTIALQPELTSLTQYVTELNRYSRSEELEQESEYWLNLPWEETLLPLDFPDGYEKNTEDSRAEYLVALSENETRQLLQEIPSFYQTSLANLLMIALIETIGEWTKKDWVYFGAVDSGRTCYPFAKDMDLSRTIGWFAFSRAYVAPNSRSILKGNESFFEKVRLMDEQLNNVPNQGIGYTVLARLGDPKNEAVKKLQQQYHECKLFFNYLGRLDNPSMGSQVRTAKEKIGYRAHPKEDRFSLIDCYCYIREGRLNLGWGYSANVFKNTTIEKIAHNYEEFLKEAIKEAKL
jgi:amino acid adenylation domain-containing protein/non-ribosomal peptide synthase protein (TIGR01720 family)